MCHPNNSFIFPKHFLKCPLHFTPLWKSPVDLLNCSPPFHSIHDAGFTPQNQLTSIFRVRKLYWTNCEITETIQVSFHSEQNMRVFELYKLTFLFSKRFSLKPKSGGGDGEKSRALSFEILFGTLRERIGRLLKLRSLLIKSIALSSFSREPLSSLSLIAVLFDESHSVNSKIPESSIPPRALANYFSTAFNVCLIRLSISTLTVWESA